jgi:hydroxymethylpyrimidine/phosphomethylpyrimidine kinase
LITPNIYEASLLTDYSISTQFDVEQAAIRFLDYGAEAVLVKGGCMKQRLTHVKL